MKANLNISNDSKNQFMQNQNSSFVHSEISRPKADQLQKMFLMFQKMATDPSLFVQLMSSVNGTETEANQRTRQFQVQQHKYRNHEVSPRRRDANSPIVNKQSRKKGTDVLGRSYIQENDNALEKYYNPSIPSIEVSQNLGQNSIRASKKINSPVSDNQFLQNKTQNKQAVKDKINNEDDRPIKPAKGYNYEAQLSQSSLVNNSDIQAINPDKYYEAQNRPIKGIQGDFKAFVMKEQGFPLSQQNENNNEQLQNSQVPKARTFLKKGSRQHLSSAIDKSVPKLKVKPKALNIKQQLDTSNSNLKEPTQKLERSISQNRVLGRKSISSKSISKRLPPKQKQEQNKKTLQYSSTTQNYHSNQTEGNKTPRVIKKAEAKKREESASPKFQMGYQNRQKKQTKKNIFQDSSSSEEEEQKRSKKQDITLNKSEVIPGVYLTKKQLHQILAKHGKNSQPTSGNQAQLQQLKAKYIDLCNLLAEEKQMLESQMLKQKQQFQQYKQSQLIKIKNEKKVQERNLLNNQNRKQKDKQKEDFEALKKVLEKQREQFRHKQKNYKIMIQKYKKLAEQKQKTNVQSQKSESYEVIKKQEKDVGSTNRKKGKIAHQKQTQNVQYDDVVGSNSYKGVQQNIGYNINRKENESKDISIGKQIQKAQLPSYQDLKKPTTQGNKSSGMNKDENKKNDKYEYYEELSNKQTIKDSRTQQYKPYQTTTENQQDDHLSSDDGEQIVEYNPTMKISDLTKIPLSIKMVNDQMIENLFKCQNNPQYKKYLQLTRRPRTKIHTSRNAADKKVTNVYADGGKEVIFDTGVRKQYFSNGYVIIFFANGDIKQKLPDETVLYFYREKEVDQITLPNKVNIYRFENNQVQFHFEDKSVEIRHPDGTFKVL